MVRKHDTILYSPKCVEGASLLKNSFVLSSAPGSGAEYVVFVAFRPCFRISWTADRTDNHLFNTLERSANFALTEF